MESSAYFERAQFLMKRPTIAPGGDDTELQYSPTFWSKKFDEAKILDHYCSLVFKNTEISKKTLPCELGVSYGKSNAQKVDIFGAKDLPEDAPVFVFIHGGYWILGSREESGHFAKTFHEAGVISVALGYDLVGEKVRVPDIVKQIIEGINFVLEYAYSRKSKGVYICGHSAGGHLATTALSTGSFDKEKVNLIKGVIILGGLFDLSPLLNKHPVSKEAKLTKEIVDVASPITIVDKLANNINPDTKFIIVSCDQEAPAFQSQSKKYEEAMRGAGINSEFLKLEDEDHFSIGSRLGEKEFILTKVILDMIQGN